MKPATVKLNKIVEVGMVVLSLALLVFLGTIAYQGSRVHYLTLAAGSPTGESYILSAALKTVVERHNPRIRITLRETGGTVENLRMLENGSAQLAVAQADVLAGPSARILAVLYDDTFQLLARRESAVQNFSGLRGKTIALPLSGGQFQSFLHVASHFGLGESDFRFVGDTDAAADESFLSGGADAVFRVRALGNPAIQHLVQTGRFRLVQIDHAAAMKINYPAFDSAVIPAGAYLGNPAVPEADIPSISVRRTLLATSGVDDSTVAAITEVLIERRQEIAEAIPEEASGVRLLLVHVRRPDTLSQLGPALHPGAIRYYDKDKPSFIQAHSDFIGLILTILVMVGSWIWELRAWLQRQQKNIADQYSNRVVALMNAARDAKELADLDGIRGELLGILTAAVGDLDSDRLSEDAFHSFRAILQIGLEEVRDRWAAVLAETESPPRRRATAD
jgi:TRAP transporter TAXI family solute receptor